MRQDRQYLERHGAQWRVQMKVPEKLRSIVGKARLVHPLHTDSLANANRDKHSVIAAFKAQLAQAEAELRRKAGQPSSPLIEDALRWREAVRDDDEEGHAKHALEYRYEEVQRSDGPEKAGEFVQVALGLATPLGSMVAAWLAHEPMKPRQQLDYRRAVTKLEAWCGKAKLPATIEAFTRKTAGRYVSEGLVDEGVQWRTANKDVACLSSYWKFLDGKGFASENVWTRQSVPERRTPVDERKRPFTDAEVQTLMAGTAPAFLKDAITIAALSGMRVEEIARQKVESIWAGCFTVKDAKTEAGNRSVPVHSALTAIVERRCKGKAPGDYLFPELPTPAPGSAIERSQKIVKAFTKYRRKLGVDDMVPGARQSRVDLHSFRRWFSKKAGDALNGGATGFSPWTLADVMGHNAEKLPLGMTMAHYPGQSDMDTRRACVEAVKLPA